MGWTRTSGLSAEVREYRQLYLRILRPVRLRRARRPPRCILGLWCLWPSWGQQQLGLVWYLDVLLPPGSIRLSGALPNPESRPRNYQEILAYRWLFLCILRAIRLQ